MKISARVEGTHINFRIGRKRYILHQEKVGFLEGGGILAALPDGRAVIVAPKDIENAHWQTSGNTTSCVWKERK